MLEAKHIAKAFGGERVLRDVSLRVDQGQVVAIIGRSGSGKSTLLRCLNHLETVDAGEIRIDGRPMVTTGPGGTPVYAPKAELRALCLKMGFVFQNYNLFPHMTVMRNLCQAQERVLRRPKAEAAERATALLAQVGLSDKAGQYPCQLSGGQQQRVAIARALALDPEILCFDEPTSALDPQLTQEVLGVIRDLAREKRTMIVVTHEMRFAREVADTVVFMQEGVIRAVGTPDEVMGDHRSEELSVFMGLLGDD
ncbi:MAG: amino acid ABC transporter ATP-binding protein [Clostridiales bacterium]|nr:amino acid ABC transporter ATP-binding protein [Clostridiales bacterium]